MNAKAHRARTNSWIWSAIVWLALGVVDGAQTVIATRAYRSHDARIELELFWRTVLFWLPWAIATVPVVHLARRFSLDRLRPVSNWVVHVGAWLTIDFVSTAWNVWLERLFETYRSSASTEPVARLILTRTLNNAFWSLILYAGIVIVSSIVDSRARLTEQRMQTARLNEQLSLAQLDALRKQIEPHFLFNTLNAVSGLIRSGRNEDAVTMIAGLSDFLRHTLERSSRQQVPLVEELEFAEMYLSIEKVRFADRMQVYFDVPMELYLAQVPSLILQPIVENAVRHGIARREQGGAIRIGARLGGEKLTLTVSNDGPTLLPNELSRSGIGNANVRTRLKSLYRDEFEFTMRNGKAGGVEVSVSIPYLVTSPVWNSQ